MGIFIKGSKSGSAEFGSASTIAHLRETMDGEEWPELKSFLETGFITRADLEKMIDQMDDDGTGKAGYAHSWHAKAALQLWPTSSVQTTTMMMTTNSRIGNIWHANP